MRCLFALLAFVATPALAQVSYPPGGAVDTSNLATKADVQAAQTTANNAATTASAAQSVAAAAQTAASGAVKTVNAAAPDGSGNVALTIPTTSSIASQISTATSGLATTSALSTVQAAIPPTCTQPPAQEALVATIGSGSVCVHRIDAAPSTVVPPAVATTLSDGSFSGNWTDGTNAITLPSVPTRAIATIYGSTIPYHCQLATMSTTGFTGKCWAIVTTTLPTLATSLLGLVVSPFINASSGLTVNVFARR